MTRFQLANASIREPLNANRRIVRLRSNRTWTAMDSRATKRAGSRLLGRPIAGSHRRVSRARVQDHSIRPLLCSGRWWRARIHRHRSRSGATDVRRMQVSGGPARRATSDTALSRSVSSRSNRGSVRGLSSQASLGESRGAQGPAGG